jgi:hypothetical protein
MAAPVYPPPIPGIPRASQSTIERYLRCGVRHELELACPTRRATIPMLIGSGVDQGAAWDLRAKLEGWGVRPTLGEVVEIAVAEYEAEAGESEVPEPRLEIERGKDDTAAAARAWGQQVSPQITAPIAVQEPLLAVLRGVELVGTPDYLEALGVGDLKTGQPWTQERADRARQLSGYAILYRTRFRRWPDRVWIDSLSHYRGDWVFERLWSARSMADYAAFLQVMERAVRAMERGDALPAAEGAWWCSPRWCPWWGRGCWAVNWK